MPQKPLWKLPRPASFIPPSLALVAVFALAASAQTGAVRRVKTTQLPLSFERNLGQTSSEVQYLARSQGSVIFLTPGSAMVKTSQGAVELRFAGARGGTGVGEQPLAEGVHYLVGNQPQQWRRDVPAYGKVEYTGLYPGVDLTYYGNAGRLEYDLRLAPGANAAAIAMQTAGAQAAIGAQGELRIGPMRLERPRAYQMVEGRRRTVAARYVQRPDGAVGFALGTYDHTRAVVIDPVLVFSTFLGGTAFNQANAVAIDASGNAYVAGATLSTDFPVAGGIAPNTAVGGFDAFVAKIATDGKSLVYSTYLGGSAEDRATGIAVDSAGDAYVTGYTLSTNFPVVGGVQAANGGGYDAFVAKLNPAGSALVYSTYLGGAEDDQATGIALDSADDALVTGYTSSSNYPVSSGAPQAALVGNVDAFVTALNPAGSAVLYSTYLGGHATLNGTEAGVTRSNGIAVDASGNAYIGGSTNASTGFPATPGAVQTTLAGGTDGFVAKVDRSGRQFDYVTYLGGSKQDEVNAIAVDASGNAFVAGDTNSVNIFPSASSAFQQQFAGGASDAFVAELRNDGAALLYGTYLGGLKTDAAYGIALDATDEAYVVGSTTSSDFPTTSNAYQAANGGVSDVFLSKLDSAGQSLLYSTFFGGLSNDFGQGIALDAAGDLYIVGATSSANFPVTAGVVQAAQNSASDAFVAKFASAAQGVFSPSTLGFLAQSVGVASTAEAVIFTNGGEKPLTITGISTTGPYTETDNCTQNGSTLQPTGSCTINVTFTPTATGAQNGSLVIKDNSPTGQEVLNITGTGGDFSVTAAPTTITIAAGASASYSFNVTPALGYTQVVALSCTGAPANTTCVPSPTSLTMNGTNASTATFTVTTTVRPSAAPPLAPPGPWTWLAILGLGLTAAGAAFALRGGRRRRKLGWAGALLLAGWALAAAGCGGTQQSPGTPAGTYTLTFTGTVGSVTHSQTVQLVVD